MKPASPSPAVSVLVASYGAEAFIERAIRSILDGSLQDLEVIVVDDVSPDGSNAIVERIAATDARVRLLRMAQNGGPAAARNLGLAAARGRWLAIVDSDDLIAPDRLATLVAAAEAAGAEMIADDLLVFDDGQPDAATRFLSPADRRAGTVDLDLATYLRRSVLYGREPNPGFLKPLIRRQALEKAGVRYDEQLRIAEDDDLVIRLLLAGLRYRRLTSAGYFYRKHGASISHRLSVRALEAMIAADAPLARRIAESRPDLAAAAAARSRSYDRALAFERFVVALKARRPDRALAVAAAHPVLLPLLRMPLAGLLRRTRAPEIMRALDDELAALLRRRDALSRS